MSLEDKKRHHEAFWRGAGPSLILIPAPERPDEAEGEAQGDAWGTPSAPPGTRRLSTRRSRCRTRCTSASRVRLRG